MMISPRYMAILDAFRPLGFSMRMVRRPKNLPSPSISEPPPQDPETEMRRLKFRQMERALKK